MKKKWIWIGLGIALLALLGTILYFCFKKEETSLIKINGTELEQKLENKDTFILLVSQEGCSHCEEYAPVLKRILKENNITAYEIDWKDLRNDENLNKLFTLDGTPTTIFINDGEEKTTINRIVGAKSNYKDLKNKLKERGFIE